MTYSFIVYVYVYVRVYMYEGGLLAIMGRLSYIYINTAFDSFFSFFFFFFGMWIATNTQRTSTKE